MLQHVPSQSLLAMQHAKCTKTVSYYKLQIFCVHITNILAQQDIVKMHLQPYFAKYFLLGCIFGKRGDKEIMEEKIQTEIRGL